MPAYNLNAKKRDSPAKAAIFARRLFIASNIAILKVLATTAESDARMQLESPTTNNSNSFTNADKTATMLSSTTTKKSNHLRKKKHQAMLNWQLLTHGELPCTNACQTTVRNNTMLAREAKFVTTLFNASTTANHKVLATTAESDAEMPLVLTKTPNSNCLQLAENHARPQFKLNLHQLMMNHPQVHWAQKLLTEYID